MKNGTKMEAQGGPGGAQMETKIKEFRRHFATPSQEPPNSPPGTPKSSQNLPKWMPKWNKMDSPRPLQGRQKDPKMEQNKAPAIPPET